MDPLEHVRIGTIALKLGLIDAAKLGQAMQALAGAGDAPEAAWVEGGWLTAEQLHDVRVHIDARPTARVDPEARVPALARSTSRMSALRTLPIRFDDDETVLFGVGATGGERYVGLGVLGEGGMGEVIECLDRTLQRRVALKRVQPDLPSRESAARRLTREAQLTGNLEHPGIVPVYDVGDQPGIGTFYTMRLVQQANLQEVLRALKGSDEGIAAEFTPSRLLRIFVQVCHAVDYAHARGVIHCDLKPANILLGAYGEVLVADWGLAYVVAEGYLYRGGTPGYMAPEQHGAEPARLEARTDVFALGAILYELLTLEYAFDGLATTPPARPQLRVPDREIEGEIDAICMKALELEPAARHVDARALAIEIEAFLDRTTEREKKAARADELVQQGADLAEAYLELSQSRPERLAEIRELREGVGAHERAEAKRPLWDAEDRLAILDRLLVRTLQAAIAAYEQALDESPRLAAAHRGLAELYASEVARAEDRVDEHDRALYDDLAGQHAAASGGEVRREGVLRIDRAGAREVTIAAYEERDRRLVASAERAAPDDTLRLSPGRYLLVARFDGGREVRAPVHVRAGRETSVDLALGALVPDDDEVFVPGGPARLGGAGAFEAEVRDATLAPFAIARFPVAFREYLAFVATLFASDPIAAARHVPANPEGLPYFSFDGEAFVPAGVEVIAPADASPLDLPVFGIAADSAIAFAAWKSNRRGRVYRLPTEDEWEKAARGTDGRLYPWGDRFDASFCKMRDSRAGAFGPEPSGVFPIDESPYGVRDMAGGVADWTFPDPGVPPSSRRHVVARGGAWTDWQQDCRLDVRRPHRAGERSPRVGFRLARSGSVYSATRG